MTDNDADGRAMTASTAALRAHVAALADQCVKCGLCLPLCPSYRVERQEAESPRGRIALAQALAGGLAAPSPALVAHLDQCLACGSCEHVCPAQVRYGELLVATRQLLRAQVRPGRGDALLRAVLARPRLLRGLLRLANLPGVRHCIQSRLVARLLRPPQLARLARELPRLPPRPRFAPRREAPLRRGRVGLFLGCVASAVDRDVHAAAAHLLRALGYEVVVPARQGCCGALALHRGEPALAQTLAASVRRAFVAAGVETVLVSASGCFGTLREQAFAGTQVRVREIHEFLAADVPLAELRFRPWPARVALHTPCTQAHVAGAEAAIRALLGRIPQLEIASLPTQPRCCGAAGDYFLRHAAIADALRAELLDGAAALAPTALVTSNVGCRLFLANGLRQRGLGLPVRHPVVLLAEQLDN